MVNRSIPSDEIVSSLMLFYVFERLCAGFMKWGLEPRKGDGGFSNHLIERKKQLRKQVPQIEASQRISPFDIGFMPRDLAEYLAAKLRKRVDEQAFGLAAIDPMPLYREIHTLINSRNKVMHGLPAPETPVRVVSRINAVMDLIAEVLGDELGRFAKPKASPDVVDHTIWARLLFLTIDELLCISKGLQLPAIRSEKPVLELYLDQRRTTPVSFRRTERHRRTADPSSPFFLSENLCGFNTIWVSTATFKLDNIKRFLPWLRAQAKQEIDPAFRLEELFIGELDQGLDDFDSDSFAIPWWKKASENERYLYIAR